MVKEEIVNRICVSRGMKKVSISTNLTWVTSDNKEGIELVLGKLKPFRNVSGIRDYAEPTGEKILQTIQLIHVEDIGKKDAEKEPESVNAEIVNEPKTSLINNLEQLYDGKRIIAIQDIEDLRKMTTLQRMLVFQKTNPKFVKRKDGRGGQQHYVEGHVMKLEAWIAFLGQVSSKIDGFLEDKDGVTCYGSLTVPIDGQLVTVSGAGIDLQEYKKGTKEPVFTLHELRKNSVTDMKKKILADMGFNRDVYSGDYD